MNLSVLKLATLSVVLVALLVAGGHFLSTKLDSSWLAESQSTPTTTTDETDDASEGKEFVENPPEKLPSAEYNPPETPEALFQIEDNSIQTDLQTNHERTVNSNLEENVYQVEQKPAPLLDTDAQIQDYLKTLDYRGYGPKGIIVDDNRFVAWGDPVDPDGKIVLLGKSDDGKYLRFEALSKVYLKTLSF